MTERSNFRRGMTVYTSDNQTLGKIDDVQDDHFVIQGQRYPASAISRVDQQGVYLSGGRSQYMSGATTGRSTEGEIHVPVVEERLDVSKRQTELGEVQIRKEVTQEQVQVPVDLMREEVRVERVDVQDRPVRPGDLDNAFQEGTIRVPVRGEEAVVQKEAVVTGEVVINKERTVEHQTISDTVRREHVDVDENFRQHRAGFEQHFNTRAQQAGGRTTGGTRRFEDAEPHYRHGFAAGHDQRFQGRNWNDVETDLRRDWETTSATRGTTTGTTAGTGTTRTTGSTGATGGGRSWEDIRDEVREGFERVTRR